MKNRSLPHRLTRAAWSGLAVLGTLAGALPAFADEAPGSPVPEPASFLVFLVGGLGVAWAIRRRS